MQNFLFGGFNEWEISVYFGPLFVLVKTLLDALTNSALMNIEEHECTQVWDRCNCCAGLHQLVQLIVPKSYMPKFVKLIVLNHRPVFSTFIELINTWRCMKMVERCSYWSSFQRKSIHWRRVRDEQPKNSKLIMQN